MHLFTNINYPGYNKILVFILTILIYEFKCKHSYIEKLAAIDQMNNDIKTRNIIIIHD